MSVEQPKRLKTIEVARYLRVSRSTLAKWRMSGEGPPHHRCGPHLVHYYQHEVDAWLEACDRTERPRSVKAR